MINIEKIKEKIGKSIGLHAVVTKYKIVYGDYMQRYYLLWDTAVLYPSGEIVHNDRDVSDIPTCSIYMSYNYGLLASKQAEAQYKRLLEDPRMNGEKGICDLKTERDVPVLYVERAGDGIDLINYACKVSYDGDKQAFDCSFKKKSYMHFALGQKNTAYKTLKKGDVPTDVLKCLRLDSKTAIASTIVVCEDGLSVVDFLMKEEMQQFAKISQLPKILSSFLCSRMLRIPEIGFRVYIALMSLFPQFELLYKMGYLNLFRSASETLACKNSNHIRTSFSKLIDDHATKGTQTLRIPTYIAEYLCDNKSEIKEWLAWCDIFELTGLSKENFEKIVNSIPFLCFLSRGTSRSDRVATALNVLPLLLRYGYKLEKLLKYLYKEAESPQILRDYLEMSEYLGIEIVLYPEDLRKRHDELSKLKNEKDNEESNIKLAQIAEKVEEAIAKTLEKENDFTVVVPKSIADFFDEGNRMNNCVGHYAHRVIDGECIIFFVRLKEEPNEGYITAEYRCATQQLGQFFYKNNRAVEDAKAIRFGNKICELIQKSLKP